MIMAIVTQIKEIIMRMLKTTVVMTGLVALVGCSSIR